MAERTSLRRLAAAVLAASLLMLAWVASVALGADTPKAGSGAATVTTASTAAAKSAVPATTSTKASTTKATTATKPTTKTTTATKPKPKPKPKPVPTLSAWPAAGTTFPQRAVVIGAPAGGATVSASTLHIAENGVGVSGVTVTPLSTPHPGDFGEVVAVDQNASMSGAGLTAVMTAVRALAAARPPAAQLGFVTFNQVAADFLPVTASAAKISSRLRYTPFTSAGDNTAAATTDAVAALAHAKVAAGALVVISDAAGALPTAAAAQQANAAAAAAHVSIVFIALKDAATTAAGLKALQAVAPSPPVIATPATLTATLAGVQKRLTGGYVARYRSAAPAGKPVSVTVSASGLRGNVAFGYSAPAAPVVHHAARARKHRINFAKSAAGQGRLASAAPIIAAPATTPAGAVSPAPAVAAPATFWSSTAAVPVVAILVALLFGLAVLLLLHKPNHRAVRVRVGTFTPVERDEPELSPVADKPKVSGPLAMFARSTWWPPFVEAVEVARMKVTPNQIVKRSAIGAAIVAALATLILQSPIPFFLVLLAWPFVVRKFVYRAADKKRMKFADELPGYLQDIASSIRVGRSFISALGVVGEGADEPMRSEFERVVTDESLGRPVEESLEAVSLRMRSTDMDQIALIAALNRRSGSNVAEALDRVAEGARDRADLRREIRALTAQAKLSSIVLTALPGVLLVGLSVISPQYAHPLFHTTIGIVVLSIGALLCMGGWKVMQKITRVEA